MFWKFYLLFILSSFIILSNSFLFLLTIMCYKCFHFLFFFAIFYLDNDKQGNQNNNNKYFKNYLAFIITSRMTVCFISVVYKENRSIPGDASNQWQLIPKVFYLHSIATQIKTGDVWFHVQTRFLALTMETPHQWNKCNLHLFFTLHRWGFKLLIDLMF